MIIPPMTNESALWAEYRLTGSEAIRNRIAEHYRGLVEIKAMKLHLRVHELVSLDDLSQWGMIGLLDAISRFHPARKLKLATFSAQRIRGAMIDGIRALDPVSRITRRRLANREAAREKLEHESARPPSPQEIEEECPTVGQLRIKDTHTFSLNVAASDSLGRPIDFADYQLDHREADPSACTAVDAATIMDVAAKRLDLTQAIVLKWYYLEGWTMARIGNELLSVSECRVCQLHTSALLRIRRLVA